MKEIVIWGGTGQCRVVNEAIDKTKYRVSAVVDNRKLDSIPIKNTQFLIGERNLKDWIYQNNKKGIYCVSAIGGFKGFDRISIQNKMRSLGLEPKNIIHKTAYIADGVEFGVGLQALAMSVVCSGSKLGEGVIINTSASIDHDCVIESGVHIGPGANLTGEVYIGQYSFIGAGSVVLPGIEIGNNVIVGAGSVVTKSINSNCKVAGNPARRI